MQPANKTSANKREHWEAHIKKWEESKLSQKVKKYPVLYAESAHFNLFFHVQHNNILKFYIYFANPHSILLCNNLPWNR